MKKTFALLTAAMLCGGVASAQQPATAAPDSITSAAADFIAGNMRQGIDMVLMNISQMGLEVDSAEVVALVCQRIAQPYNAEAHEAGRNTLVHAAGEAAARVERRFLNDAAARPGAIVTENGVVIETITPGQGPTVTPDDIVVFEYRGALPDGTVFDETNGDPITGKSSGFVPGMTEGLTYASKGGKYRLSIPSALAYGRRGAGDVIPPDTPIEFTIEIVEINPSQQ